MDIFRFLLRKTIDEIALISGGFLQSKFTVQIPPNCRESAVSSVMQKRTILNANPER